MKNLTKLDDMLSRRQAKTSLDMQELSTEFTNDVTRAWNQKAFMKLPMFN